MKTISRLCVTSAALALMGLGSCAGPSAPVTPAAAFAQRTTQHPPQKKVQDAAETYLAVKLLHPSSVQFSNEFQSTGPNDTAVCGWIKYRNKESVYTPYRPFYVLFDAKGATGSNQPFVPDEILASLCGTIIATPPG